MKADPEFIRLREEVLQLIHSAPSTCAKPLDASAHERARSYRS